MASRYDAVLFDLLSALLDSWSLWDRVAGGREPGRRWRLEYLERTYAAGRYRPYERLVREAAGAAGLPASRADELFDAWRDVEPWPEVPEVLERLSREVPIGAVTNCSTALAKAAAGRVDAPLPVVVSAERAGWYKPRERPYRIALEELGTAPERTLFVAGSPYDIGGAAAVGMPVFWHNRAGLAAKDEVPVVGEDASLRPVSDLVLE